MGEPTKEQLQGQAAVDHIYDTAKRIMLDPHPLVPMAEYFDHVLGTAGFAYGLASFEDLIERAEEAESLNTRYEQQRETELISAFKRGCQFGRYTNMPDPDDAEILVKVREALAPDAGTPAARPKNPVEAEEPFA